MRCATLLAVSALLLFPVSGPAEKKFKPWTEWSEKDARKILNDSPWGQTQVDTNLSEMFYSPTSSSARNVGSRSEEGAYNQGVQLYLRIRFLSARPIRQAFARVILAGQPKPNAQLEASLKDFVERKFDEHIVVAVDYDSADRRLSGPAMQAFNSAVASILQNSTYLELKNGKRLFLSDYKPPVNDGLGAKFIFPRAVDGQPFLTAESAEVRFYSEIGKMKLNMRFKVSDMTYDGALEY